MGISVVYHNREIKLFCNPQLFSEYVSLYFRFAVGLEIVKAYLAYGDNFILMGAGQLN